MQTRLLLLFAVCGLILGAPSRGGANDAPRVADQAWADSTTANPAAPTGTPGRLYVGVAAGRETARSFVRLTLGSAPALTLATARLTLMPDQSESVPAPVGSTRLVVCAATQDLSGSGEISGGASPASDCTTRLDVVAASDGTWPIPMALFAQRWGEGGPTTIVIAPDLTASPAVTFRLAFDAARTRLDGVGGSVATAAPSTALTSPSAIFEPGDDTGPPMSAADAVRSVATPLGPTSELIGAGEESPERVTSTSEQVPRRDAAAPSAAVVFALLSLIGSIVVAGLVLTGNRRLPERLPAVPIDGRSGIGLLAVLAALPMFGREVTVYRAGLVLIFLVGVIGLHILVNWGGQLSLAHAGMVGMPAFVVIGLSERLGVSPLYLVPVGILTGAVVGAVVALPTLRAQGLQVAIITLAAGIAIDRFFFTLPAFVGPVSGRQSATPSLFGLEMATSRSLYPVLVMLVAAALGVAWILLHSTFARALFWVNADPDAAAVFGVPTVRFRMLAFIIAGAYAGFAGSLSVMWVQRLTPQAFPATLSFAYLLVAVLAGPGFVGGLAGAAVLIEGGRLFSSGGDLVTSYLGPVALILVITRYQKGLNGIGRSLMQRIRTKNNPQIGSEPAGVDQADPSPLRPAQVGGTAAVVAGFAAITLAWYHAGNTDQVWIQTQELISGGVGGLALVLLGTGLLISDRIRQSNEKLLDRLSEISRVEPRAITPAPPEVTGTQAQERRQARRRTHAAKSR